MTKKQNLRLSTITSLAIIPGFHYWADAPEEFGYLKHVHRHLFYIRVTISVEKSREIEFIEFASHIKNTIHLTYELSEYDVNGYNFEGRSCERIAEELSDIFKEQTFDIYSISVMEDDENGSTLYV